MSSWDWVKSFAKDVLPAIVGVGATVYGTKVAADAQKDAVKTANQAQKQATQADLQGLQMAQQNVQQLQGAASPGLMRMQDIIGRGEQLTPEQVLALDDARRTTTDALNGGSLRGSARATVAAINDVDGRMRTGFMAQNRQQADTAAANLSGQYFNAGNNIANLNRDVGNTVSQGLINTGQNNVTSGINQAAIKGQAIGDIGAVIADSIKQSNNGKRDSSYEEIKWNGPRQGAL